MSLPSGRSSRGTELFLSLGEERPRQLSEDAERPVNLYIYGNEYATVC